MQQLLLHHDWQCKAYVNDTNVVEAFEDHDGWLPATVPGSIHQDLMSAGRIPNPFEGLNETLVQWVGESDWLYRCQFDIDSSLLDSPMIDWCADGLDTFATIWLNSTLIATSDNMFLPLRVAVREHLRLGQNTLWIWFRSAMHEGKRIEAEYGERPVWNGDASRVYVRKAQYHYGWDWGPALVTAGIWREMRLEAYPICITELHCPIDLSPDLMNVTLHISARTTVGATWGEADRWQLECMLLDSNEGIVASASIPLDSDGVARWECPVSDPQLWWPHGYGDQARYTLTCQLVQGTIVGDKQELRVGIRRIELLQDPFVDEQGSSFAFVVNGVTIFCGGANWIPADMFIPRIDASLYRELLDRAVQAHMVMLRVWGGGIYESEIFYDLCDELGILIWQDFMFACGLYPAHAAFLANVRAEAEAQVRRLRHHPCLALWCGNNEDYVLAESQQAIAQDTGAPPPDFSAREIYETLLPAICSTLDPGRSYWPGSPYGGSRNNDAFVGDRHTWEVWHGQMAPYQDYAQYEGRFISEFGMESAPSLRTLETVIPPAERIPHSRTMDFHNRSLDGTRRIAVYLSDNLPFPTTIEDYIYATQFIQAEALGAAIRAWRRRWGTPEKRAVGGALIWQLNDCWPGTSWSVIDVAGLPKAAYFVARRELAPLVVGITASTKERYASLWAVNGTLLSHEAQITLQRWGIDGHLANELTRAVSLAANGVLELGQSEWPRDDQHVLSVHLTMGGQVIARASLWPEPFKYFTLPDPEITAWQSDAETVKLRVAKPTKGLMLMEDSVNWSDNMLDIMPNEVRSIKAPGYTSRVLHGRSLSGVAQVSIGREE